MLDSSFGNKAQAAQQDDHRGKGAGGRTWEGAARTGVLRARGVIRPLVSESHKQFGFLPECDGSLGVPQHL